jgi:hypothetical protein
MPRSSSGNRRDCRIAYFDQGSGKLLYSEPLRAGDGLPQQQATVQLQDDWYTVARVLDLYDRGGELRQVNVFLAQKKAEKGGKPAANKPVKAAASKRGRRSTRSMAAGSAGTVSSRKRRAVVPEARKRRSKRQIA